MSKQFWKWSNGVESTDSKLILEGAISSEDWWGDGMDVTPKAFRDELAKRSGNLTVSINSPGGDVFAGVSIYNTLVAYDKGDVTIEVNGLAASIASVIAMAGDKVVMLPGSSMMIHKPWSIGIGNADELQKVVESLESIESSLVPIYTAKTGLSDEKIKEMLADETWLNPQEAVELGFADELVEAKKKVGFSDSIKNALKNGQFEFAMSATKEATAKLVEKIKASEEKEEVMDDTTATTPKAEDVEQTTEAKTTVDTETKAEAEVKDEAEQTDTVEKSDNTEPEETKSDIGETNAMNETIAKAQVKAPAEAPEAKATVDLKAYLKTNEAMDVFARILESNPGEMGGDSSAQVRNAWKEHLKVKAGVTNPEVFLPTPLVTAIQNAFEDGGEIWNRVAKVGADVWNAAWDAQNDVHSNDGRARGYNRADEENKAEQVLTFDTRLLRPQFVYKYITLNKEDIKEQRSTGALVTYILSELPQRIVREVERAIVLGDGRASNDDYKIKEGTPRGFYPLVKDALANNYFGATVDASAEILPKAVALAKDKIRTAGEVIVIAKKGFSTEARFATDNDGKLLYPLGTKATDVFDVTTVIEPDWFDDVSSPTVDAIVVVLEAYKVVGDTTIEGFQNFILKTNKQEYLQEIWAGGGATGKKCVIALTNGASS